MKGVLRVIVVSLLLIFIASLAAVIFGFVSEGGLHMRVVFNANFAAGAVIICAALVLLVLPVGILKPDKLADHSTVERLLELREHKRKKAYELLFTGIMVIFITGLIQLALAVTR